MPSSARDRFTVDFEYVFFFVKYKKYWFEQQRDKITTKKKSGWVKQREKGIDNITPYQTEGNGKWGKPNPFNQPLGKNKRTVWKIPTKPNKEAHFATFPPNLIIPMIKSGCPEFICKVCGKPREKIIEKTKWKPTRKHKGKGYRIEQKVSESSAFNHRADWEEFKKKNPDKIKGYTDCGCLKDEKSIRTGMLLESTKYKPGVVLDPFAGTGTTLKEAWKLGRNYIGFELSKEYCEDIAKSFFRLYKK